MADTVVIVHLSFVLFVVLGGLLVLRFRSVVWLHVPSAIWGILIEFANWTCPLTPLENRLRNLGGQTGYTGDFIERYLVSILYPDLLTRRMQIILGFLTLTINLLAYWRVFLRWRYAK